MKLITQYPLDKSPLTKAMYLSILVSSYILMVVFMKEIKKFAYVSPECVACGYCAKVCPLSAISVPKGIRAEVDKERCVGCGKCAKVCPAQVINIIEKEVPHVKKESLV